MINVVLSGGSGTRLWPLSRTLMPKQFLKLFNNKSLFQMTIERNSKACNRCIVVSNDNQYFIALDQLEELDSVFSVSNTKFLLENVGKNTAPAIALACLEAENEIVFVTPSDHLIRDEKKYIEAVEKAEELANEGYLVTFGIEPTKPHTGYGYIEGEKLKVKSEKVFNVIKFHEKPNLEMAKQYIKKNAANSSLPATHYFWNSGMFAFKSEIYLEELKKYSPEIYEGAVDAYKNKQNISDNQIRFKTDKLEENSIDYAVLEKSRKIKVVKSDFRWNDVGSFDSLKEELKDKDLGFRVEIESKNNFYYSDKKDKLITTIGLEDFIVIDTDDALLITKKGETQKVKDVVNKLKSTHSSLLTSHSKVHRPWGSYEVLVNDNYKIKRIVVKPGKRLSLQKHYHRNEHWIVVSGTALVQVDDKEFLLRTNESTYIKAGQLHRLANPGKIPVVLIEAQVGEYIEEDDIVRIEDDWGRNG